MRRNILVRLRIVLLSILASLFFFFFSFSPLQAQIKSQKNIDKAMATWDFLSNNVQLGALVEKDAGGKKIVTGTATSFNQTSSIEFTVGRKVEKIAIIFPEAVKLDLQTLRSMSGQDFKNKIPAELGAAIKFKQIAVNFSGKKISAASITMEAGTWAPFKGESAGISDIHFMLQVNNPVAKRGKSVSMAMDGNLTIPESLRSYTGLGETNLNVKGEFDGNNGNMSLIARLKTDQIPLHPKKIVVLKEAKMELFIQGGVPGLAMGGKIELRPPNKQSMTLDGEISIDLTGEIFAQGYMSPGQKWHNPLGLSDKIDLTQAGFGLGVAFKTTPVPMPIIAVEGGFKVRASSNSKGFEGKMTVGFHGSDPTQNMIDAEIKQANLNDIISAFYPKGTPPSISEALKKINLRNAKLTIVPPGPGIDLFGKKFDPGVHVQGNFDVDKFTGSLLIAVSETEALAYGSLTPIKHKGFKMTSATNPALGPEAYVKVGSNGPADSYFGLDGAVEVIGVKVNSNIYMSSAGFNLEAKGNVFNAFKAELDIAGTNIFKGGTIYAKASFKMKENLAKKISEEASAEIDRYSKKVSADLSGHQAKLRELTPKLEAKKAELKKKQEIVRKDYERLCGLMNQKIENDKEIATRQAKIDDLSRQIKNLNNQIANGTKPARFIKKKGCAPNSLFFPLVQGGTCWSCPGGYDRAAVTNLIDGPKACWKKPYQKFAPATYVKNYNMITSPCASGDFADVALGKCYTCPSGYKQVIANPTLGSKKCVKNVSAKYTTATKTADPGCAAGQVDDIPRGECWQCPSGYIRPAVTVNGIQTEKACALPNLDALKRKRDGKVLERTTLQGDLEVRMKGFTAIANQLTQTSSDICNKVKDTDAINADPRVAPTYAQFTDLNFKVKTVTKLIEALKSTSSGALGAASWIVKNGGSALGIVHITEASFEGCLSTVSSGSVRLKIKGMYAGTQPINGSFDINFDNPSIGIKKLGNLLLTTKKPAGTINNGTCKKPIVPKPNLSDSGIAAFKAKAKQNPNLSSKPRVHKKDRPGWAGNPRFKQ